MAKMQKEESFTTLNGWIKMLWDDYAQVAPQSAAIRTKLQAMQTQPIRNDHIAFRTFGMKPVSMQECARIWEAHGYTPSGDAYTFKDKHLRASWWKPPHDDLPKIFISELDMDSLTPITRKVIEQWVKAIPSTELTENFMLGKRFWNPSIDEYQRLLAESEYAGWMAAFGFRANHFTIDMDSVERVDGLHSLNLLIESWGHRLNASGGKVKGTTEEGLCQSSTLAAETEVAFKDGTLKVPSCYYEFAKREVRVNPITGTKERFEGFVPASADKIFESTDVMLNKPEPQVKKVNCPICKTKSTTLDGTFFPFCSQRCKQYDLGKWLNGSYVIAGNPVSEENGDET